MVEQYILAIDQSTSGTKAILFNREGLLVHRCTCAHRQIYPKQGWAEHDPLEIYEKTTEAIKRVLLESKISISEVKVISVTNQRETVMVWDKETGEPIYNAIVWQCSRANHICHELEQAGYKDIIKEKTGLVLSPYFSGAKVKWLLDNVNGARKRAEEGKLIAGTMDSWIIWKLTGGKVHATDYSNASRTQLFNINELKWDKDILSLFTIPESMMPEVKFSDEIFGVTAVNDVFDREIPISGVMGDSQAALFGQNCFNKGMAKATYGTGSSIMMNIGGTPVKSQNGLVTSIAWGLKGRIDYAFEGNINYAGDTIKWLVDDLELIPDSKTSEQIAQSVESSEGVYFVPAFSGLGAPYWDSGAKAIVCGINRSTKKAHIVRAAIESIAYQIKDITDIMCKDSDIKLNELRVDGGPTKNNLLMKFQADIMDTSVVRCKIEELSAMGSAYIAGLAVGIWNSLSEIEKLRQKDITFTGNMDSNTRNFLYEGWKESVSKIIARNM